MKNRKVKVFEWVRNAEKKCMEKVYVCNGIFHQFGINYEEFDTGPGQFTTAIIEKPSGEILNIQVELVEYLEKAETEYVPCKTCGDFLDGENHDWNSNIELGPINSVFDALEMPDTVPCKKCGEPTQMTATKLCDGCWEAIKNE